MPILQVHRPRRELIVGLQTDSPQKRAIMPKGGWRIVETSLRTYGYEVVPRVAEIRAARRSLVITGLPDSYGRARITGDYRRLALYGVDRVIADKGLVKASLDALPSRWHHGQWW